MASIRVLAGGYSRASRVPGTRAGVRVDTFGIGKLKALLSGENLARIAVESLKPAEEQALTEWPVITGASKDTIEIVVMEVEEHSCRVALQVGGQMLIDDPRNKSHKDYAPFVEYNGTSKTPSGTITHAIHANEPEMRATQHRLVRELLEAM